MQVETRDQGPWSSPGSAMWEQPEWETALTCETNVSDGVLSSYTKLALIIFCLQSNFE